MRTIRLTILILSFLALATTREANGQTAGAQSEVARQVPAALPKLALKGTVSEFKSGIHYYRIVLTITNWEKYNPDMFAMPIRRTSSPNACEGTKSRIVTVIYSERGAPLSGCLPMHQPTDLSSFSFLFRRGPVVPQFIYAVLNDQYTGAVYRSNLVSPSSGATK